MSRDLPTSGVERVMKAVRTVDAQSQLRATVSRALGRALVLGIDECEQEGHPLTQVQQISLATMAIMCYDQALEGIENLDVELHSTQWRKHGEAQS